MDGVRALDNAGYTTYLEIGPSSTLATMARRFLDGNRTTILASVRRERSAWHELMLSAGILFTLGVPIRWRQTEAGDSPHTVALPTYPFDRQRYWVSATASSGHSIDRAADAASYVHPLLGRRLPSPLKSVQFERWLSLDDPSYLADHVIHGAAVFPAAAYVEMALAAAAVVFPAAAPAIDDLALSQPLVLPPDEPVRVQTIVTPSADGTALVEILSGSTGQSDVSWTLHASTTVQARATLPPADSLSDARARCDESWPAEELYDWYQVRGIDYGPSFRGLAEVWRGSGEAVGRVQWPDALADGHRVSTASRAGRFESAGAGGRGDRCLELVRPDQHCVGRGVRWRRPHRVGARHDGCAGGGWVDVGRRLAVRR